MGVIRPNLDEALALLEAAEAAPTPTATPTADLDPPAEPEPESEDPVVRMQQLLIAHEQAHLHEVEDPELVRTLDEIRTLAFSNIADIFHHVTDEVITGVTDEGEAHIDTFERLAVTDITRLPRHVSGAIKKVKCTRRATGDQIEVEMYDKQVALEKLMRYHGAYVEDNRQRGSSVLDVLLGSIGTTGLPQIEDNSA